MSSDAVEIVQCNIFITANIINYFKLFCNNNLLNIINFGASVYERASQAKQSIMWQLKVRHTYFLYILIYI